MTFTTRPELRGTFGMVASTHWLASAAGMAVLERGGNAFDAAVATGLHAAGRRAAPERPGRRPARRALERRARRAARALRARASRPPPPRSSASGSSATTSSPAPGCSPPACPARSTAGCCSCATSGRCASPTCSSSRSATPRTAIRSSRGSPPRSRGAEPLLRDWPASAELYLPAPQPGELFRNRQLAATYGRIVAESLGGDREAEIERARDAFYRGFVADAIDAFCREHGGLLDGDDLASWRATLEPPATFDYRGHTVCKTGPWGQGPVLLQQLALLAGFDLARAVRPAELVHTVVECAKLAFADREAFYGDPASSTSRSTSCSRAGVRRRAPARSSARRRRASCAPGGGRLPTPRRGRDAPSAPASRRAATPSTSTWPTASATSCRRRRAAAGCRARR